MASYVERLLQEDAVLLGVANMDPLNSFRGVKLPGWSPVGGRCIGPYGSGHDPRGSSTGSAVAVAMGMAPFAFGTNVSHPRHGQNG
jgi:amidase